MYKLFKNLIWSVHAILIVSICIDIYKTDGLTYSLFFLLVSLIITVVFVWIAEALWEIMG